MGFDFCGNCIRRARHVGGNESCPVFDRATLQTVSGPRKESVEEAWTRHRTLWVSGCSNFKPGERRTYLRTEPTAEEQMGLL